MKQRHVLDLTTLQILFSERSDVKHALAAESVMYGIKWLCAFH